jgi:hypothetical protein
MPHFGVVFMRSCSAVHCLAGRFPSYRPEPSTQGVVLSERPCATVVSAFALRAEASQQFKLRARLLLEPLDKPFAMLRSLLTLILGLCLYSPSAKAQQAPLHHDAVYTGVQTEALWQHVSLPNDLAAADRIIVPLSARYVAIDWSIMDAVVQATRPMADDERKVITSIRLDLTPQGVHAQILRPEGTVYMDPVALGQTDVYQVYHRRDFRPHADKVRNEIGVLGNPPATASAQRASGDQLRTYRLALACTGEYAQFHGGTVAAALGAMATTMNRVNGIYERDFSVRMELIPNNDLLIFLDADADPYTNLSGFTMLGENQSTVNSIIGSSNYDVGHVFSTGGGGIASLGSVCDNGNKARGVTGLPSPIGDPFDVDYVSHEFGHQFRGEHSFNHCGGPSAEATTMCPIPTIISTEAISIRCCPL